MGGTRAERGARDAEMGWEGGVGRWMALTFPREASHPRERSEPALGWPNASEASQTWGGGGRGMVGGFYPLVFMFSSISREASPRWSGRGGRTAVKGTAVRD